MAKRLLYILFGIIVFIGITAASALIFVTSNAGSAWISSKLHKTFYNAGFQVDFKKIDLKFFPPRLLLEDLEAKGVNFNAGCSVKESELSPSPLDLLSGNLRIEEIYLGHPSCKIILTQKDMDNLRERSKIGDKKSDTIDLDFLPSFDVVAMSEGDFFVQIDDPGHFGNASLDVTGFSLDITGRKTGSQSHIEIRSLLDNAKLDYKNKNIQINEKLKNLKFRTALTEKRIDLRYINGIIAGINLNARDISIPFPVTSEKIEIMFLKTDIPLPLLNRLPLDLPVLEGNTGFSGQLSFKLSEDGLPSEYNARGKLFFNNLKIDEYIIGSGETAIALSNKGVAYSELLIKNDSGQVKTSGSINFDEKYKIEGSVILSDVQLATLLENLTVTNSYVMQKISGNIDVAGTLAPFNLKVKTNFSVKDLKVFDNGFRKKRKKNIVDINALTARGNLIINDKSVTGSSFTIKRKSSSVVTDFKFNYNMKKGWKLNASSGNLDLKEVGKIIGVNIFGKSKIKVGLVSKNYGAPKIEGNITVNRGGFNNVGLKRLKTDILYDKNRLELTDLNVLGRVSHYSTPLLLIDFESEKGLMVKTDINIDRAEISDLAETYKIDTEDYGSPKGYISGIVNILYEEKPENLKVSARVNHEGLTLFNEVFGPGILEADYDQGALNLNRLDMSKGKGKVLLFGTMSKEKALNFTTVISDVEIEDIVFPAISDLDIKGTGQIFAVIEGTTENPTGHGTIRISDAIRKGVKYGSSQVELMLNNNKLIGRGSLGGGMITLEHGVADFENDKFNIEAFISDMNFLDLMGKDKTDSRPKLNGTGELFLEGGMFGDLNLTGLIRLFKTSLTYNKFKIKNKNNVEVSIKNGKYTLKRSRFTGNDMVMDVAIEANNDKFKLNLNGIADMAALNKITPNVKDANGRISANILVDGPWDDPSLKGGAEIKNGELLINGFPSPIKEINGKINMGTNIVWFNDFAARSQGGLIDLNGFLKFDGNEIDDYKFTTIISNMLVPLGDTLNIKASTINRGLIVAPGKRGLPFITGDVEISNLNYNQDVHIIEMSDLNISQMAKTKRTIHHPRLLDKNNDYFEYDIKLHGDKNISIINNLADAKLKIDDTIDPLRFVGSNQHYGFLGSVLSKKGEVRFAGKTFDITSATVSFKDPLRPDNPYFTVSADVSVRDWKISILAEGTVEEYTVTLSSQPHLTQEDIIILLLTGLLKEEHSQYGSQGLSMSLAPIIENVSSGVIPVEINVYSEYSEKAGTDTTRIALGKKLTDDIWLKVSSSIGQGQDVEGTVSYKINDNLSLSASYDNKSELSSVGNWGVDLKFRLEF